MIHVIGLRRSGIHAVKEWIARHMVNASIGSVHHFQQHDPDARGDVVGWEDCELEVALRHIDHAHIVLVRSFYNMIASRIAKIRRAEGSGKLLAIDDARNGHDVQRAIRLWPEYAESATMLFDKWLRDEDYQHRIEDELGLPVRVSRQLDTADFGSSFERGQHDDSRLEFRWQSVNRHDPLWLAALRCDRCRQLNEQLFGWTITREGVWRSK